MKIIFNSSSPRNPRIFPFRLLPPISCPAARGAPPPLPLAQERPYFVTYSHEMEEPGNLDIENFNAVGSPPGGNSLPWFGRGIRIRHERLVDDRVLSRWPGHGTTVPFHRLSLGESLPSAVGEHWINPVLYVEFEDTSADKTMREVVGHDGCADFLAPNWRRARTRSARWSEAHPGQQRKGWNFSENFIAEKNLAGALEFGYAIGVSRPLRLAASSA